MVVEEKNELISISKKHLKILLDQENFLSNVLKIKINEKVIESSYLEKFHLM